MRTTSVHGAVRYVPSLDGLRAVSVLLVIVSHMLLGSLAYHGNGAIIPAGFGITLFFWISGYLLTGQMLAEFDRTGRIIFRKFYLRRALRLMPTALLFIIFTGSAYVAMGGTITPLGWLAAVFYGANYYPSVTSIPPVRHAFSILWSLAVEEHFYVIWPATLLFLLRRRQTILPVLIFCLAELFWRAWLYQYCLGSDCGLRTFDDRFYSATDTRLDSIAWGALTAIVVAKCGTRLVQSKVLQTCALGALAAAFLIRTPQFRDVMRYTLQGFGFAILIPAIIGHNTPVRRSLETLPMVFIGRLSYGLYLWHWTALMMADWFAPDERSLWLMLAIGLTILLSLSSWYGIERPIIELRRRAGSHASADISTATPRSSRLSARHAMAARRLW